MAKDSPGARVGRLMPHISTLRIYEFQLIWAGTHMFGIIKAFSLAVWDTWHIFDGKQGSFKLHKAGVGLFLKLRLKSDEALILWSQKKYKAMLKCPGHPTCLRYSYLLRLLHVPLPPAPTSVNITENDTG